MKTFSALLAFCAGNSPVHGEFPAQRPVTRSFDVFFDLRLNKGLSKQSRGWWFETLSGPLWRHSNDLQYPGSMWHSHRLLMDIHWKSSTRSIKWFRLCHEGMVSKDKMHQWHVSLPLEVSFGVSFAFFIQYLEFDNMMTLLGYHK